MQSCSQLRQSSPGSQSPLPQLAWQSLSYIALHPAGQQPSPLMHTVSWRWSHSAMQVAGFRQLSLVQESVSVQSLLLEHEGVLHLPLQHICSVPHAQSAEQVEQLSANSQMPLPQLELQSLSERSLHPTGQQPSLFRQATIFVYWQCALQPPVSAQLSNVQALPSSHS
jgi:hypothetical protein